jgi:hypothetical protein
MQRNGVLRCRGTYPGDCDREAATSHDYPSDPQHRSPILNLQHVMLPKPDINWLGEIITALSARGWHRRFGVATVI